MVTKLEPVNLTEEEAIDLNNEKQRVRDEARRAFRAAQEAHRVAELEESDTAQLVADIRYRATGKMRIVASAYPSKGMDCAVTVKATGRKCTVSYLEARVAIWHDDNSRTTAHFCRRHKRHSLHFGVEDCDDCGSTAMVEPEPDYENRKSLPLIF